MVTSIFLSLKLDNNLKSYLMMLIQAQALHSRAIDSSSFRSIMNFFDPHLTQIGHCRPPITGDWRVGLLVNLHLGTFV